MSLSFPLIPRRGDFARGGALSVQHFAFFVAAALLACSSTLRAGSIELKDGKTLEGAVNWSDDGMIHVTPDNKLAQTVDPANVAKAVIDPQKVVAPVDPQSEWQVQDSEWQKKEFGKTMVDTALDINSDAVSICNFLLNYRERMGDGWLYVHKTLVGDGEIIARYEPKDEKPEALRACLMIREGLEPGGAAVMIARGRAFGDDRYTSVLVARGPDNAATRLESKTGIKGPVWLKLTRTGETIAAFDSADGKKWNEVGSVKMPMPEAKGVYIGVGATSFFRTSTAEFSQIEVRSKPAEVQFNNLPLPAAYVMTRSGSIIAGAMVSCTETELKVQKNDAAFAVPIKDVAWYQFTPMSPDLVEKALKSRAGAMLRGGDFVECDVRRVSNNLVHVSSIILGVADLEQATVKAIIFGTAAQKKGDVEVRLQDRSVLQCRSIKFEKGEAVLDEPSVGALKVPARQVLYIERRK